MSFSNDPSLLINQLPISVDFPLDPKQSQEIQSLTYKRIANVVNTKTGGLYSLAEIGNSEQYFIVNNPNFFRNVYRKTINFGSLPNTASKTVAHGITGIDPGGIPSTFSFTHIYATASDQTAGAESFIPIPFASPVLAENIKIEVNNTNVVITTGSNRSNYTICYVILEYLKN